MGIVPRQRPVATALTALLVVGAVLVLFDLAHVVFLHLTGSDRPSDRRCAELWNGPASQTNRSSVRGRSFPLATVRGVEPNKAGLWGAGAGASGWTLAAVRRRPHRDQGVLGPWRVRRSVRDR